MQVVHASSVRFATVLPGSLDMPATDARRQRRMGLSAMAAVAVMCVCTYAPTIHLRSHYSDDFPNRLAIGRSDWWGACGEYRQINGVLRPLGYMTMLYCQQTLWDYPAAQQSLLLVLCVALCLLMYQFVVKLTGDRRIALAAGAILAAWPSYTPVVVWVAGGLQMLPAYGAYLIALVLYLRHLESPPTRRWWGASLIAFAVSITLHDQHLGAVAVFSVLACLRAGEGARLRAVLGTVPFWLVALAVGLITILSARGTQRPVEPAATNLVGDIGALLWSFVSLSLVEPFRLSLYGAGPRESISRMAAADPVPLAAASTLLVVGVGATIALLGRLHPGSRRGRPLATLTAVGATLTLAGLGIMALRDPAVINPRHTLVPAIGVAMMLAAGAGAPGTACWRGIGLVALGGLLAGLSIIRLGNTYEWTTRARVTDRVLACLDELYPTAGANDVLVIDGVRRYGRGFADSWGLSGALSLRRGVPIKVTTFVRRRGDRLYANADWDEQWPVDPNHAHFFEWNERSGRLRATTFAEFLARHRELDVHQQ